MKYSVYSVRDEKTSFAAPFIDVSDASAERGVEFAFKNQSSLLAYSPADFSLYKVGFFDAESGIIEPIVPPAFVCNATKFTNNRGVVNEEQ